MTFPSRNVSNGSVLESAPRPHVMLTSFHFLRPPRVRHGRCVCVRAHAHVCVCTHMLFSITIWQK